MWWRWCKSSVAISDLPFLISEKPVSNLLFEYPFFWKPNAFKARSRKTNSSLFIEPSHAEGSFIDQTHLEFSCSSSPGLCPADTFGEWTTWRSFTSIIYQFPGIRVIPQYPHGKLPSTSITGKVRCSTIFRNATVQRASVYTYIFLFVNRCAPTVGVIRRLPRTTLLKKIISLRF